MTNLINKIIVALGLKRPWPQYIPKAEAAALEEQGEKVVK